MMSRRSFGMLLAGMALVVWGVSALQAVPAAPEATAAAAPATIAAACIPGPLCDPAQCKPAAECTAQAAGCTPAEMAQCTPAELQACFPGCSPEAIAACVAACAPASGAER